MDRPASAPLIRLRRRVRVVGRLTASFALQEARSRDSLFC